MTAVKLMIAGASLAERRELAQSVGDTYVRGGKRGPSPEVGAGRLIQLARVEVEPGLCLLLYVLGDEPGFGLLWGVLAPQMTGYLVLARPDAEERVGFALEVLRSARQRTHAPFIIGVSGARGDDEAWKQEAVAALGEDGRAAAMAGAMVAVDCGDRESVKAAICALLRRVQRESRAVMQPGADAAGTKGGTTDGGHAVATVGVAPPRGAGHRQPQH